VKYLSYAIVVIIAGIGLSGCADGFPDEEMHFGIEDKVRPYAVLIEPAEAAPGETVQVTLLARAPEPDELDITWRVALDFNRGLYETDEVERNYRDLEVALPVADEDGFLTQTFNWVVPDSALLVSSSLPEILEDPAMVLLAEGLIGPAAGSPPTKSAVDAWLKALTPADLEAMDPMQREATWALADRFACQVRFRTTLLTGRVIDVTRNLTIRHTRRLAGPNTNHNARVTQLTVAAVEKENATRDDLVDPAVPKTNYPFITDGNRVADRVQVPRNNQWTYYLRTEFVREEYSSPFDPTIMVTESSRYQWYYYRQDQPTSGHQFFVNEDGEEAEMWDLDEDARIMPAAVGSVFRIVASVRDSREDWVMYNAVPGSGVEEGIVEFVAP
jgi:hypothetical protein